MRLSPPTVHEMLGRLEQDGYVTRDEDKSLGFTVVGLEQAEAIVGRHRLIERFLTDVVGIAWDDVHEEAGEARARDVTRVRAVDDHRGRGREDLPARPSDRARHAGPGRPARRRGGGPEVEMLRFENEAEDLLHYLKGAGMAPA